MALVGAEQQVKKQILFETGNVMKIDHRPFQQPLVFQDLLEIIRQMPRVIGFVIGQAAMDDGLRAVERLGENLQDGGSGLVAVVAVDGHGRSLFIRR
jgi:hypothetical protein